MHQLGQVGAENHSPGGGYSGQVLSEYGQVARLEPHCEVIVARWQVMVARWQVMGAKCQVMVAKCQVMVARCQVMVVRCQVMVARCKVMVVRCQVMVARCHVMVTWRWWWISRCKPRDEGKEDTKCKIC